MSQTITAVFDGNVLRPEAPVDLEPNQRYRLTIEPAVSGESTGDVWDALERLASTIDAPSDWSAEHNHYLYGVPKSHQSA